MKQWFLSVPVNAAISTRNEPVHVAMEFSVSPSSVHDLVGSDIHHSPPHNGIEYARSAGSYVEPVPPIQRHFVDLIAPGTSEAISNLNQASNFMSSMTPEISTLISDCQNSAASITKAAEEFSNLIGHVRKICDSIPAVQPFVSKIISALTIMYDIVVAILKAAYALVPTLIVRILQLFGLDIKIINSFIASLMGILPSRQSEEGVGNLEMQGDDKEKMGNFFTKALGMCMLGKEPSYNQIRYVNEALRLKDNLKKEATSLTDFIFMLVRQIPDQLQEWLNYVIPMRWWLRVFAPGTLYYNWVDDVNTLDSFEYKNKASFHPPTQKKILELYRQGQEVLKVCTQSGPKSMAAYRLLESTFKKIDALYALVDMSALHRVHRAVPFVVYLYGQTGQGKSFISTVLPAILAECDNEEPNLSYSRNAAIDFWDGYTGQFAVKYDDYGATSSQNVKPGEHAELISIVSNEQYRVNKAAVEDKGDVFRSQVIIITSNTGFISPNSIADREALWRRRHAMYRVKVKPEYRMTTSPAVDPSKIPDDCSHWIFNQHTKVTDDTIGPGCDIDYQQFIANIKRDYKNHRIEQERSYVNVLKMIDNSNRVLSSVATISTESIPSTSESRFSEEPPDCQEPSCIRARNHGINQNHSCVTRIEKQGLANGFAEALGLVAGSTAGFISMDAMARKLTGQTPLISKWYEVWKAQDEDIPEFGELRIPAWVKALDAVLPVVGIMLTTYAVYDILKFMSTRIVRMAVPVAVQEQAKEQMDTLWFRVRKTYYKVRYYLTNPRVQKIDAQGRWARLFNEIRNLPPGAAEEYEAAIETIPDLNSMTDQEVEDHINELLSKPKIQKWLTKQGAYSGNTHKPQVIYTAVKQAGDENAIEVTNSCILGNLVDIENDRFNMHGLMIGGRLLMAPNHFFQDREGNIFPQGVWLKIRAGDVFFRQQFNPTKLVRVGQDVAIYECDSAVRAFRDIRHHFMREEDKIMHYTFPGMLASLQRNGRPLLTQITTVTGNTDVFQYALSEEDILEERRFREIRTHQPIYQGASVLFRQFTCWFYEAPTTNGTCGAPLIAMSKVAPRKLIGIHVAGKAGKVGVAHPVTQQMIAEAVEKLKPLINLALPIPADLNADLGFCNLVLEGNFSRFGTIARSIYVSDKTKLKPSPLFGKVYPMKTAPSVLTKFDIRNLHSLSPLKEGVQKYGNICPLVNQITLDRVVDGIWFLMKDLDSEYPRQVVSEKIALNGVEGIDFMDPMNMYTSPGYPYNQVILGKKGKFGLIQGDEGNRNYEVYDYLLRTKLDQRWEYLMHGKRVESIWLDTLKDERRTLKKVIEAKTRVFTIPPVDFTIVARRLFMAFNTAFYANRLRFFSAVGIDPNSLEWTQMYNQLITNSRVGFAGDFAGWDGNLSPQFMQGCCTIINRWYNDSFENQRAREIIFDELIHTVQCSSNVIYSTHIGNPSGNPFTAILNTMVDAMYLRYVYLTLAPALYNSLAEFNKNVVDKEYGDDNIVSVTGPVLEFFNPTSIREELLKLNMDYTSANKNGPAKIQPIKDLTFLKRGFRITEDSFAVPLMDLQTITELVNWIRENQEIGDVRLCIDNVNDSLQFIYFYGRKTFEQHRNKILAVCTSQIALALHDFAYFEDRFHKEVYNVRPIMNLEPQGDPGGAVKEFMATLEPKRDDSEDVRAETSTVGIITASQRAIVASGPTQKPRNASRLTAASIPTIQFNLQDMVGRRIVNKVYQWSTTQTVGTTIVKLKCPQDLITNFLTSAAFERFLFWRGSMEFDVRVTGMRQHMGRLQMYFVPFVDPAITAQWHEKSLMAASSMNPVYIDAAANPEGILGAPFYNPKTYITLNGLTDPNLDFCGTFIISVQVPLQAADCAPSTIDFNLWVRFPEDTNEFHVPLHSNQALTTRYNLKHQEFYTNLEPQGATTSSVANYVVSYGDMDGTTIPQSLKGDDFSGMASGNSATATPFDRAARTWNPFNIIRKYAQNFSNSNGSELVNRLDLNPSNMNVSLRDHFSTDQDEMKMDFLLHKPTWVANVPWPATATPGQSLYSGFIGPMCSLFSPGTDTQVPMTNGTILPLTMWEYNAMHFAYWRGGMRLRFDVVATQFHVGQLVLTINYGVPPEADITLEDATSQYAFVFEISNEKRTFEIDIPYVAPTAWMNMCRGPESPDDVKPGPNWWNNYFIGSWSLKVVNRLVTVCASPPDAVIVLYYCGSPDFQVYMPSNINQTLTGYGVFTTPARVTNLEPQSGTEKQDGSKGGEDAVAVPPIAPAENVKAPEITPPRKIGWAMGDAPTISHHFGSHASVKHVRDTIRRYIPLLTNPPLTYSTRANSLAALTPDLQEGFCEYMIDQTVPGAGQIPFLVFHFISVTPWSAGGLEVPTNPGYSVQPGYITPIKHFGNQFRFWRGSMRYKIYFGAISGPLGKIYPQGHHGAVHIPHSLIISGFGTTSAVRPNSAVLACWYASAMGQSMSIFGGATNGTMMFNRFAGNVFAGDKAMDEIAPYVEVEVPFITRYNVLLTPQTRNTAEQQPGLENAGQLLVFSTIYVDQADVAGLIASRLNWSRDVVYSVGDDFRMGVFCGAPLVAPFRVHDPLADFRAWPDSWFVNDPARKDSYEQLDVPGPLIREQYKNIPPVVVQKRKTIFGMLQGLAKSKNPVEPFGAYAFFDSEEEVMGSSFPFKSTEQTIWTGIVGATTDNILTSLYFDAAAKPQEYLHILTAQEIITILRSGYGQSTYEVLKHLYKFRQFSFNLSLKGKKLQVEWQHHGRHRLTIGKEYIYSDTSLDEFKYHIGTIETLVLENIYSTFDVQIPRNPVLGYENQTFNPHFQFSDFENITNLEPQASFEKRKSPTEDNISQAVESAYKRYIKEDHYNARMALNEIVQMIEESEVTYDFHTEYEDKIPIFTVETTFLVNCTTFDNTKGHARGKSKTAAKETSAAECLEHLHYLSRDDDPEEKQLHENDICRAIVYEKPIDEKTPGEAVQHSLEHEWHEESLEYKQAIQDFIIMMHEDSCVLHQIARLTNICENLNYQIFIMTKTHNNDKYLFKLEVDMVPQKKKADKRPVSIHKTLHFQRYGIFFETTNYQHAKHEAISAAIRGLLMTWYYEYFAPTLNQFEGDDFLYTM